MKYLLFAMLALHGTKKLLQAPMMGYWLVGPVLLILVERLHRFARGFMPYPARLEAIGNEAVLITVDKPEGTKWNAHAGQYVSSYSDVTRIPTYASL